jgi:hypothetical protein
LSYQNATNLIQSTIQNLFADSVMSTGIVVGGILLTADQEFGMEELAVVTGTDFVDGRRIEIDKDGTGHIFTTACLCEDSIELSRVVKCLGVRIRTAILLETMLK